MSELTLLVLKLGFLAVLWVFVFMIVYALRSDLFGQRARRMPADAASAPFPDQAAPQPHLTAPAPGPGAAAAAAAPVAAAVTAPQARPRATADLSTEAMSTAPGSGVTRLVITSGAKEGLEVPLEMEQLTIGRSADSGLVIRDDYTSTHHARLLRWDDNWMVQDLDSTNGTFVDGNRIGGSPVLLPMNTEVRIGTTTFELRR